MSVSLLLTATDQQGVRVACGFLFSYWGGQDHYSGGVIINKTTSAIILNTTALIDRADILLLTTAQYNSLQNNGTPHTSFVQWMGGIINNNNRGHIINFENALTLTQNPPAAWTP